MRTSIFFSSMIIADAINKNWINPNSDSVYFILALAALFFYWDINEFDSKRKHN